MGAEMRGSSQRLSSALCVSLLIAGCADNPPAPIETRVGATVTVTDQEAPETGSLGQYTVQPGDTLYSIAFRYGVNVNELAARNQIKAPYTIYPGQQVVTDLSDFSSASTTSQAIDVEVKPVENPGSGAVGSSKAPVKDEREETAKAEPEPASKPPPTAVTGSGTPRASNTQAFGPVTRWRWPSGGRVVRSYSDIRHKGIDIAGSRGDLIRASAAGEVVYAGTGLKGYGLLLIVKHNEQFLSAYGHNDANLVEEGAWVDEGQVVAKMGSSGTDSVKLHFEIRREGQPIDPLKLLPQR